MTPIRGAVSSQQSRRSRAGEKRTECEIAVGGSTGLGVRPDDG